MNKRILVIEDEIEIADGIKNFLESKSFTVDVANDGLAGTIFANRIAYDLIILDVMLPKMDGYTVLEVIRGNSDVPIIMLTAMDSVENQIKGFDLKADDYITKPFDTNLFLKRIEAIFRRSESTDYLINKRMLQFDDIQMNEDSCEVYVKENLISLTSTEFNLLKLFLKFPLVVFSRDEILTNCWGKEYVGSDFIVNVHVGNLRKKIGENYIETVRGMGYKLVKKSSD